MTAEQPNPLLPRVLQTTKELHLICDALDHARNEEIDALFEPGAEARLGEQEHTRRLNAAERAAADIEAVRTEITQALYRLLGCVVLGSAI